MFKVNRCRKPGCSAETALGAPAGLSGVWQSSRAYLGAPELWVMTSTATIGPQPGAPRCTRPGVISR